MSAEQAIRSIKNALPECGAWVIRVQGKKRLVVISETFQAWSADTRVARLMDILTEAQRREIHIIKAYTPQELF